MLKFTHFIQTLIFLPVLFSSVHTMAEELSQTPSNVQQNQNNFETEHSLEHSDNPSVNKTAVDTTQPSVPTQPEIKPLTQAEIKAGLAKMEKWMVASIDEWGKSLKAEDFERTWTGGRQLVKAKRQEVCGIYQRIVNETYRLANDNKLRLSQADQAALQDRNAFIQNLGFKNNIVDTKMGFNCRIK